MLMLSLYRPADEEADGFLWVLSQLSSTLLTVVGVSYALLGCLCIKKLKESKLMQLQRREHIRHEKAELEMRKNEIETLLKETELKLQRGLV